MQAAAGQREHPGDPAALRSISLEDFLADQPSYLVPERLLSTLTEDSRGDGWFVSESTWFGWREPLPSAVRSLYPLPRAFQPEAKTIWVEDPVRRALWPFWAGPWFQGKVSGLERGMTPPALSAHHRFVLAAAGILISPDRAKARAQERQRLTDQARERFVANKYVSLEDCLHPFHLASLRLYYRRLLRSGGMTLGDNATNRRYVAHNESVARFFHSQLTPQIESVVGAALKPSYVYVSSYQGGASLPIHTDREQCEYTLSLLLDCTPEPLDQSAWPLYLQTEKGTVGVWQRLGDALLFRGREVPHYRDALPEGRSATSIFFHFVPRSFDGALD